MYAPSAAPERRNWIRGIACLAGVGSLLAVATVEAQAPARLTESATEGFECKAAEVLGLPAADAATAVSLVCEELARVSDQAGRYGVSLRPLGRSLILSVTALPGGDVRSLTLADLDETPLAATRLAEALVLGRPIERTQRVDNLLAAETRRPREKKGSRKIVLGVAALDIPGTGAPAGSGVMFGVAHETPAWAVLADLQYAATTGGRPRATVFAIAAGARRYLSRRDVAPYVGGGIERLYVELARIDDFESHWLDDTSLVPYVEAGVQALRLNRARITVGVRTHLPLWGFEQDNYPVGNQGQGTESRSKEYVAPLTLGMTVSF